MSLMSCEAVKTMNTRFMDITRAPKDNTIEIDGAKRQGKSK